MKTSISSRIIGFGRYAPERRVHNSELESRLGLAPGWIERRTGIRSRRYAAHDEALTDLAFRAGAAALASSTLTPSEFGLTLLATSTPDHLLPPSAPLLADRLGLARAGAIDLTGACAGFIYALVLADGFVRSQRRPVLVVAANVLSRRINPDDRTSSILFGDAAGALALAPSDDPATGVLGVDLFSAGAHYDLICIPAGGSRKPFSQDMPLTDIFMRMPDGKAIFSLAVEMMTKSSRHALNMAGLTAANITRFAPHQANGRIIDAVRRNLCLPEATLVSTIAEFGNSSAATIPFSLAASSEAAPFQPGERILLTAVGAGMTGGAAVVGF